MENFRKQIKISFFNPIIHFLPLLLFLVTAMYAGRTVANYVSIFVLLVSAVYVFIAYNQIFIWFFLSCVIFLAVNIVGSIIRLPIIFLSFRPLLDEALTLVFLGGMMLLQKPIKKGIMALIPKTLPMNNNLDEYFGFIRTIFLIILGYVLATGFIYAFPTQRETAFLELVQAIYVGILFFVLVFESLRVQIIRARLMKEEWLPIVNSQGKIIGSVQHQASLGEKRKFMHPIIRVHIIQDGMILLRKRPADDLSYPLHWDTAISNHIRMGETVEDCIKRTAQELYGLTELKSFFLSNYITHTDFEQHYAFLFIACKMNKIDLQSEKVKQAKWWTLQQIEENLQEGIFTENFLIEFDLLKKSGVLENNICDCACKLKETIFKAPHLFR